MIDIDDNIKEEIKRNEKILSMAEERDEMFKTLSGKKLLLRTTDALTKFLSGNNFYVVVGDADVVYHMIISSKSITLSHNKTNKIVIDNPTVFIAKGKELTIFYLDENKEIKTVSVYFLYGNSQDVSKYDTFSPEEEILKGLTDE